jgi:hypothetical protein
MLGALDLCGALVLGSMAVLALRQLDGFAMNVNGEAMGSAGSRGAPLPAPAHPDGGSACTQARIDRTTGETIISECPPRPSGMATLAAWLAERVSTR